MFCDLCLGVVVVVVVVKGVSIGVMTRDYGGYACAEWSTQNAKYGVRD